MQTVDENPDLIGEKPETIHLYVVREENPRPPFHPIILSLIALFLVAVVSIAFPFEQPEERKTLRIPAVFLPLKSFTTSVKIIPTGIKTFPAKTAHGILTITNGSIISQIIPQGFTIDGVVIDTSVFVPAGSANGYGVAIVSAHAVRSGKRGNIPAYDINQVEGSSVYIRNLTSFTGGRDEYSIPLQLPKDRQTALDTARVIQAAQIAKIREFLAHPCEESLQIKKNVLVLSWTCQYVTYSIPSYMHITRIRLVGKDLLVDVVFVVRFRTTVFK